MKHFRERIQAWKNHKESKSPEDINDLHNDGDEDPSNGGSSGSNDPYPIVMKKKIPLGKSSPESPRSKLKAAFEESMKNAARRELQQLMSEIDVDQMPKTMGVSTSRTISSIELDIDNDRVE